MIKFVSMEEVEFKIRGLLLSVYSCFQVATTFDILCAEAFSYQWNTTELLCSSSNEVVKTGSAWINQSTYEFKQKLKSVELREGDNFFLKTGIEYLNERRKWAPPFCVPMLMYIGKGGPGESIPLEHSMPWKKTMSESCKNAIKIFSPSECDRRSPSLSSGPSWCMPML